jgi:biopolymer transport protein ExbD
MAQLNEVNTKQKKGLTKKMLKKVIGVDLTPMVDLGFLLITFFMFTTVLASPKAVKFRMPKDAEPKTDLDKNKVLVIIADSLNNYYTYEPIKEDIELKKCKNIDDVRNSIIEKNKLIQAKANVILKLHPQANYKNFIELRDEMTINNIEYYIVDNLTVEEKIKMKNYQQ